MKRIERFFFAFEDNRANSNSHGFELHGPLNKGTKLLLKVIKAIIISSGEETFTLLFFLLQNNRSLLQKRLIKETIFCKRDL